MQFNPNDRHILVITGEQEESLSYAKKITSELDSVEIANSIKAQGLLGQELDAVIFDIHEEFHPNAFGAISGTIRGGGFFILLRPKKLQTSLFLQRLNQILENTRQVHFLNITHEISNKEVLLLPHPPRKNFAQVFATKDQENAVAAIIKVAIGHRRRPLIIKSDRGRGKSAALGIAAAKLVKQGYKNIIICAPSKKTAAIVFKHADLVFGDEIKSNLKFYSPDDLQREKPEADLVLIDEAASIPIPLLTELLKHYSRIVFSSTQHGYEGSGRGFAINFRKVLDKETPQWKSCELVAPIRWQENDTLEQFTFNALLLNAEAADKSLIKNCSLDNCHFSKINKNDLLINNDTLKQLFGLLVSAHYQTKPSDLMQLLDDENFNIFCLTANDIIVAVALVITEGNIDLKITQDIFKGKRRLQGHLVAQALSSNIGIEIAPQLSGERISRIAVHPHLQDKGLGSYLIQKLLKNSYSDYFSTSYGATEPLLHFWKKSGFIPVHLGIKRDASSGAHSVIMLHSKNEKGIQLTQQAQLNFSQSFPHLLSDSLSELESGIVLSLFPTLLNKSMSDKDKRILESFAHDSRGFENSLYLIWELVSAKIVDNKTLSDKEKKILIIKVLQKHSWKVLIQKIQPTISGKKEALILLRQSIAKLL